MNYEKKYKEALERARDLMTKQNPPAFDKHLIEIVFPELAESEDEKIKREIVAYINELADLKNEKIPTKWLVWLEKQGNKIVDCQQNHQDVKYPNGGIVMEDFNGGEGFYKLHLDYLSKKQVEEVEAIVRTWNKESKTSNEIIKNCVEMCLADADEQRFEDFGTTLKDCLAWLEKQGENKKLDADKVIEWLKNTIRETKECFGEHGIYYDTRLILPYNFIEDLINDFKEDFGL